MDNDAGCTLIKSIDQHSTNLLTFARAFEDYSAASSRHASRLAWATWALVGVIVVLAIVAGVQVYIAVR